MPRRKIEKENVRKIQQSKKGMYSISIPIRVMRKLGWRERQKVVVRMFGKGLRIKDWPIRQAQGKKKKKKS